MYFETHSHYDFKQFDEDRNELLSKILPEAGIDYILNVGTNMQSSRASVPLTNLSSGTFEGTGTGGYYGDVSVAVTVDASGSIAGVEVTYHNETPAFANRAFDSMIPAIISAQTYDVDTIGGATHSSTALRAAVQDALNQAQN